MRTDLEHLQDIGSLDQDSAITTGHGFRRSHLNRIAELWILSLNLGFQSSSLTFGSPSSEFLLTSQVFLLETKLQGS